MSSEGAEKPKYSAKEAEQMKNKANFVIQLSIIVQWANLLVLPSIYDHLAHNFGFSASELGLIQTMRTFSMFAVLPVFGVWSSFTSRRILLGTTMILVALITMCHVFCTTFWGFMCATIMTGIMLGSIHPIARSLIAAYYPLEIRGQYYGSLELGAGIGGVLGAIIGKLVGEVNSGTASPAESIPRTCMTYINQNLTAASAAALETLRKLNETGTTSHPHAPANPFVVFTNPQGWQLVFLIIGGLTVPCGIAMLMYIIDPIHDKWVKEEFGDNFLVAFPGMAAGEEKDLAYEDVKGLFNKTTFAMIILQGVFGAFPWSGLSWMILFFEKIGMSNIMSVLLFFAVGGAAAIGGGVGGCIGDVAQRKSLKYGRIVVSHFSVFLGVPLACMLFLAIPRSVASQWLYLFGGFIFGISISWPPANLNAMESDMFEQHALPLAMGVAYFCEGTVSAWSSAVIGWFSELFYGVQQTECYDYYVPEKQAATLAGMANSICVVCVVCWSLSFMCYIPMYFYYPSESNAMKKNRNGEKLKNEEEGTPAIEAKDVEVSVDSDVESKKNRV